MQEKPPGLLTAKQPLVLTGLTFTFVPTVDHKFLMRTPAELLKGDLQRKNILLGANSHEGSMFAILLFPDRFDPTKDYNANVTSEQYREMVKQLSLVDTSSDVVIDTIASIYSLSCRSQGDQDGVNYFMALAGLLGDVLFNCPVLNTATSYAREVTPIA